MRTCVACAVIVLALLGAMPGVGRPVLGAAQSDEPDRLVSDRFGLTVAWDARWRAVAVQDGEGIVHVYAVRGRGTNELAVWAIPAFGGNEAVCITGAERRLLADSRNADVKQGDPPRVRPIAGGASALLEFDFTPDGGSPTPWTSADWCLELRSGYSVLLIELSASTEEFAATLEALEGIDVQTTDDLPAPAFAFAAERDDPTSFWSQQFAAWGRHPCVAPSHVGFSSRQTTGCGTANPLDAGWFYCTVDNAIFMDTRWQTIWKRASGAASTPFSSPPRRGTTSRRCSGWTSAACRSA